ncbi:MAG: hypothetical protein Q8S33_38090 [Myxococcales bacterium]|nr:hypothetical protein [Myxococcales bacterium]
MSAAHSLLVAQQATALVCIKAVMLLCALCPVWRMRPTGVGPLLPHADGEGRRWKFW